MNSSYRNVPLNTREQSSSRVLRQINSMEKKNIRKYYLRYVFYYFSNTLITGGIIQSFMLEAGIGSGSVSVYTAIIQFVQAGAMLLLGPVIEKRKNIIRLNADAGLGLLPVFAAMLAVCFIPSMSTGLKYALITGASVIAYLAYAVIGILEYKIPYRIFEMEHYGYVVSITGMVIGMTSLACSSLISFFVSRFDYFRVMPVFLMAGILLEFAAARVGRTYRYLNDGENTAESSGAAGDSISKEKNGAEKNRHSAAGHGGTEAPETPAKPWLKEVFSVFSYGPFRDLFVPNLFRGIASGTFALLTTVGYYYSIIDATGAGLMASVSNVVIMAGCYLYARLSRKKIDGPLILASSVGLLILLPGMLLGKSALWFIVLYGAGALCKNFIDYICPVICAEIVDYEHVGQFSAWRIALYMFGAALAGLITVPMLTQFGGIPTMLFNGVIFVVTGVGYWRTSAKYRKTGKTKAKEDT